MTWEFKTPLSNPENAIVKWVISPSLVIQQLTFISIVFVHGLGGNPKQIWRASNGLFWPKDPLESTIPEARIFSWGNEANVFDFWQKKETDQSINDHARSTLSDLAGVRITTVGISIAS
jgi:hypothetical protein